MGAMGMIAIKGGGALTLQPGAMVQLSDLDNLRVLATNKGLILDASNNGRSAVKLVWKSKAAAKAAAKAASKAATTGVGAAHAKSMVTSAKSLALSAETLTKAAKSMSIPAKSVAAGAAKVAGTTAGTIWTGTGMSLGLGLGLGALGPVLLLGALAASTGCVYYLYQAKPPAADPSEY